MTVFQRFVLDGTLTPAHLAKGITVTEDDHGLYLVVNGVVVVRWGIYARIEQIKAEADKYL